MEMSLVNAASNADLQSAAGAASLNVLKKSMDLQAQTAATLIEALPQTNNPPNLGQNVDVRA